MQVGPPSFSSSSPLSSLVASSNPSMEPAAPLAGARAKVTYSRKPVTAQEAGQESSSSSLQPASPSDHLFDIPMRSYGRKNAAADTAQDQDANDVTITTAEDSPATTAHAANSTIKLVSSCSLFRRVDSQPSQHSDNDDEREQISADSPAVHRPKKFNLGASRAIFDSDSDNDAPAAGDNAEEGSLSSRLASKHINRSNDENDNDDDAVIARIRAQRIHNTESDPFGDSSLSSVPMSSSQVQSSLQKSDEDMVDDDAEGSIALARPRGAKISAMRGKGGQAKRSKFSSSSSDKDGSAASDDEDAVANRKARTFKLASSPSSSAPPQADGDEAEAGPSTTTLSRRQKMDALAARIRKAHRRAEAETEPTAEADPLIDAFVGGASPGHIPSRSPSLDIQDSDDDEHNDAMPSFMAPKSKQSKSKAKSKKSKRAAAERDILSDLEDHFDRPNAKVASKRTVAPKEKGPPKVKPLSKKEIETMNRQTARIARENRARLSSASQRKTIGLNDLLNKIQASEGRGKTKQGADASNSAESADAGDRSDQPSSQIPSGQFKSQHASDPIESDPIPERSSPHPNYSSSPVVPVSRQQERRLGLDQFNSSANILSAGRVPGVAAKPDEAAQMRALLAGGGVDDDDDDDDDAQLPDLASIVSKSRAQQEAELENKLKQQQLRDMKLRLLEKSRQQQQQQQPKEVAEKTAQLKVDRNKLEEEGDDLEVYEPGQVLAQKHNLPTTPGRKRPTDMLYRELGIKPGKTPPGRKLYAGTDAKGSPNAVSAARNTTDAENEDIDDLMVTDSQLRTAGKGLFVAADQAAGNVPATQPQPVATEARQDDNHAHPPATQGSARAGPLKMTQAQLNATLMRKMQTQSLQARSQKDSKIAKDASDKHGRAAAPDVKAMLAVLSASAAIGGHGQNGEQDAEEDEDDPDFIMPSARDAESVIGSDVDMGSASEAEAVDDADDFIDMGSADEDEENQDVEEHGIRDTIEDAEEEHDSEKENAPPLASQQSQLLNASPSLARALPPSRAVMDDDEDELPAPRATARRGRRSALADDEDGDDDGEENSLQPGPFERSRGNINNDDASQSPNRARVPLGDISSQSIDQSMPFSRSNTSSPAIQHAQPPPASAIRRDPLLFPSAGGQEEDESFRTDDIPSQAGDLGRFFEPTMPPPAAPKSLLSQAPQKSFWDQTQTQSQSQTQDNSQLPQSTRPAHPAAGARGLERDESANSALGAFFQDTQQDELRGESLDIFENPKNAGSKAHGFTQFFFDGTPSPSADARGAVGGSTAASSVWDASTMPPPKSTEVDAFAALRKAQMGEGMELLDATPSVLPSFDESQAEREAYAQAQGSNMSPEKMYMNRDGFFTQTKPSQQAGLWSQYDSQSQSQSQARAGAALVNGTATQGGARRGSEVSNVSHAQDAGEGEDEEDEEDAPVQLKRLRRGVAPQPDEEADGDFDSEVDENNPPSSQPEPKPRNAFDVLRQGPIHLEQDEGLNKGKKRKSAFIEGEAEESEDEELGGDKKRGDGGGLKGIFGDDNDHNSAADEDEDDEDDADAEDLKELVDNERELDEAEKDEIALARYREDMEAQDREALAIHTKAAQGGLRNRRRGVGLDGIEGFLDDDADEEELKRLAALGSHMSSGAWKKRKLLDGTEDGMDALAAHDEANAFVKSYEATHRIDHESEKYDFLAPPEGENDDDEEEEEEEEEEESEGEDGEDKDVEMGGGEEDAFGPVVTKQPRTIRFQDVRTVVQESRKANRRRAFDDDESDEESRKRGEEWDSDEDESEVKLAASLRNRIKHSNQPSSSTSAVAASTRKQGAQYGRSSRPNPTTLDAMEVDPESLPNITSSITDIDIEGEDESLLTRLISRSTQSHPPSSLRHSTLSMAVDTLDDAEPEWGNDANIVRAPKPNANAGTSQNSTAGRGFKVANSPFGGKNGGMDAKAKGKKEGRGGRGSMLLGKEGLMRRESGFSSSSSGSGR